MSQVRLAVDCCETLIYAMPTRAVTFTSHSDAASVAGAPKVIVAAQTVVEFA